MRGFFSILLTITALASCAKKAPLIPVESTTKTDIITDTTNKTTGTTTQNTPGTTPGTTTPTKSSSDSLTYLALGDSYTIGQSVPLAQSFPFQLTGQLNTQTKVGEPTIIATTGWTTNNLISGINVSNLTTNTYDFVTLLIGVNDQYQGVSEDTYKTRFTDVLNVAIRFARGKKNRVFVLSIPDYSVTPFAQNGSDIAKIAREIDEFNAINKTISTTAGVNYMDITDLSRLAANDPSLVAYDGLHPTGKMYATWVKRLAPLVKAQL